ncbi:MAG: PQQ-binding-like beta-propeller repeat protein [Bacteroidota bacterium]
MKHLVSIISCIILFSNLLTAQDAAQWRGKDRDGVYHETGLLKSWPAEGPKLLWHYDNIGDGFATASVVSHDRIFTAGVIYGKGTIFALSLDGKLLWSTPYGDEWVESYPGSRSTPLYNDGKVYLMSAHGKIVCLSADNGNLLWSVDIMKDYDGRNIVWGVTENLLIDGDKLFCTVGGVKDNVIALNKNSGKLIWSNPGNGEISAYCSPAIITLPTRKVVVTMTEKSILGLDAETGKKLWSYEQINMYAVHANTPIYSNGYLYCVSGYGYGGAMLKLSADGTSVEKVWKNPALDNRIGGVVLLNGRIYGLGDKIKGIHVLDWKTGEEVYFDKFNGKPGTIISAEGMIYTYDEGGEVALLEPTLDGVKKISSFKVPYGAAQHWAHPVIDKGRLYIRHGNSLMVYDIRN